MIPVSVVIPFHNNEQTLERCIRSALCQNNGENQILLIDNNSTDNSAKLAASFEGNQNVNVYKCTEPGSAHARNLGLDLSIYDFIQFLDADDHLLVDKLSLQLKAINTADVISSAYETEEENFSEKKLLSKNIWEGLILGTLGVTSSMLFKKSAVLRAGKWDIAIPNNQEYDLIFRILKTGGSVVTQNEFTTIKDNRQVNSISNTTKALYPMTAVTLRQQIEEYLSTNNLITPSLDTTLYRFYYDKICWLHSYDPEQAIYLYNQLFSDSEKRKVIPYFKRILESLLGFGNVRKIRAKFS